MIVGITGGIGSGKSTVAAELAKQGFAVYDCDREAKRIIAEDANVRKAIISLIGDEAFVDGQYNTPYVAKRVFAEPALLQGLNAIVHPAVAKDISGRSAQHLLFVESAILYESGFDRLCDKIFYIDAPEELRIARTITRDGSDAEQVRARIHAQAATPHKEAIVLLNDGSCSIASIAKAIISLL